MAKTLTELPKEGQKVRYLGGETNENALACLTVGKVYEIKKIVTGLEALLVSGSLEMSIFRDDSPSKHWTIAEDDFGYYELVE